MFKTTIYKTISKELNRLKHVKSCIKEHEHLFNHGIWLVDLRCGWKVGGESGTLQLRDAVSPPLDFLNRKIYDAIYRITGASILVLVNKNAEKEYKIDLVFTSRRHTIKFFDIRNGWVLTYYPSSIRLTEDIKSNNSSYFILFKTVEESIVTINGIDYKREKYIDAPLLTLHAEINKFTLEIFYRYHKYLQINEGTTQPNLFLDCISYLGSMISESSFEEFINRHLTEIKEIDKNLIYYPSHGDFNCDNILIHEGEIIVIDLEEFGTLLPGFFDLMYISNALRIKRIYTQNPYSGPFMACVRASFTDERELSFPFLKFMFWIFYHAPFYRKSIKLSVESKMTVNRSWKNLVKNHLSSGGQDMTLR